MKKRVFFAALALFSFAAFFSCSNAAGGSDSESSKPSSASASKKPGYVTLTGTVSVSGAVPKILSDNYDSSSDNDGVSRSAQPGINTSGDGATMEYFARATSGDLVSEGAFGTGAEAKMFGLELQAGIEWTIVVGVREKSPSKPIPARTVYLSSTWKVTPDPAAPTISHNFVPVPNTSGGTGSIALKINYSPSLYEVKLKFVDGPDGVNLDALNFENWTFIAADGGRIYKRSSIPSGKYELCLDFKNTASQVLVYSTIQSVTVANGMITDSWVADSSSSAVSPISAAGEFKFDSNASTLMTAFLGTNLFVGKVSDDCAAPDDTNSGNYLSPLKTVTGAVKKIAQAGSGGADYVIRVSGEVSGDGINSAATITSSLISTSNAKSLTIIGTSGSDTDCIKSASSQASAVNISTNVPITFKKIKIMGSKSGAGAGEAINAFGGSKVTIDEDSKITGGKIGVNVTGDSTKVTMKGGSFSGNDADVYLESGKVLTVDGNLGNVADKGIVVSLQSWTRGTQFLEAGASLGTLSDAIVKKFDFTKTGWDTPTYDSDKKAKIDADIYVAANGVDKDSENVENTIGNKAYPFKTIAKAAALLDASHNKICIDGSVGKQTISATDLPTSKCSSLILCGANGLDDDDIPKDKIDAGGTSDCGTALTIGTAVPITIQNLKITGGNKGNSSPNYNKGGGIYLQSGSSLELADGAMVTGNTCGLYGGGIYTESNTTLFMYGTSYVGDKTATTASGKTLGTQCSNSASFGGGLHNAGKVYLGYKKDGSSFKEADWTGGICRNDAWTSGGGIYNSSSGEIKMRGGTISYNSCSSNAGGIAVSASGNAVELLGGTLKENAASSHGGAIYVENKFSMQGSAYIPSGVKNDSGVLVTGDGKNDVYLVDGKTIEVAGAITPPSGVTTAATITMQYFMRGKNILSSSSTLSNDVKALFKLTKDDAGWERENDTSSDTKYVYITSPIYVVASSSTYGSRPDTTWGWGKTKNAGGNGTKTSPYSSIEEALKDGDIASVKKIKIAGTVKGNQSIASVPSGLTALEITGYDSNAKLDGNNSGSTLVVNAGSATFPVTISNLTITGGNANLGTSDATNSGGGIRIESGTVKLAGGASVTGNKATTFGGGVYVMSGAKLLMYGSAWVGDSTATTASGTTPGTECANSANYGGGIYAHGGIVALGYSEYTDEDTNTPETLTGGVGRNYAFATTLYYGGGGIYSMNVGTTVSVISIKSGKICYNKAKTSGGAICNRNTLHFSGGTISNNEAGYYGGAIYQEGTFNMSGSATVSGGSEKNNDVCLPNGKYITLPKNSLTGSAKISRISTEWNRGKQVLAGTYAKDFVSKFSVTDSAWSVVADGSVGRIDTGTTIYVSNTGDDSAGRGTSLKPYATIQTAAKETWKAQAYTISVSGTLKATSTDTLQSIPNDNKVKATQITLSGSSATINADSKGSALTISKNIPVYIKNITITGGSANKGGGLYVGTESVFLGDGVVITGNSTPTNNATYGGAGAYVASGAKLFMYGTARIGGSGTTAATTSSGNYGYSGAGILSDGNIYLGYKSCASTGVPADTDAESLTGGVTQNYAESTGGGITLNGSGKLYIRSGNISYNSTKYSSTTANGGGIACGAGTTVTMKGGTIAGNMGYNGGGVYLYGNSTNTTTFTMSDGTIGNSSDSITTAAENTTGKYSNYSTGCGAGVYADQYTYVTINGGAIKYNYTTNNGGGLYTKGTTMSLNSGNVSYNRAGTSSSGNGGGVYVAAGTLTMSGGTIAKNKASNGGGVYTAKTFTMIGGVIGDSLKTKSPLESNPSTESNSATNNGGGIYCDTGSSVTISAGYVNHNFADKGGGIYFNAGSLSLNGGNVSYNGTNAGNGGGIYLNANATLTKGAIQGNQSHNGAGMYIASGKTITISGVLNFTSNTSVLRGNSDTGGGAIYNVGTLTISGQATFTGNKANGSTTGNSCAGAIYNSGSLTISGAATMNNNSAVATGSNKYAFGGAIYNTGTLTMSNGSIGNNTANTASYAGGAIYQGGTATIKGSASIKYGGSETSNDIYLASNKTIGVDTALSNHSETNQIGVTLPSGWTTGTKILSGGTDSDEYAYTKLHYKKFKLTNNTGYYINQYGKYEVGYFVSAANLASTISNLPSSANLLRVVCSGGSLDTNAWNSIKTALKSTNASKVLIDFNESTITSIPANAFQGCTKLYQCYISDDVTSIGNYAFDGCTNLIGVQSSGLSYGTHGVKTIGEYAFQNCSSLQRTNSAMFALETFYSNSFKGVTMESLMVTDGVTYSTASWKVYNGSGYNNLVATTNNSTEAYIQNYLTNYPNCKLVRVK
ncbi:MAG: leucine-rich repeat protein [Treponema sp.]|nr:leucine-rich repeat protein [Treponema sp.]MEE3434226.1 leucine-rich repeat protein [Treponema sp.]